MDTQFSKWSYDLNEGTTGVPFVMAQAPTDTHERLMKVDRELWVMGDKVVNGRTTKCHSTARTVLERAQKSSKLHSVSRPTGESKLKISTAANATSKEDSASKRAALITKSKHQKTAHLWSASLQTRNALPCGGTRIDGLPCRRHHLL